MTLLDAQAWIKYIADQIRDTYPSSGKTDNDPDDTMPEVELTFPVYDWITSDNVVADEGKEVDWTPAIKTDVG